MENPASASSSTRHEWPGEPSPWVRRFAPLVPAGGAVLDVAAGGGRHARLFLARGHSVTCVDRDVAGLVDLGAEPRAEVIEADLEDGGPFPLAGRAFAGIVVANYLWRPLFEPLLGALAPGGALLYETFARGNERYGRPRNPDHLLRAGELLELVRGRLHVIAFEQGIVERVACPGVIQRLAAVNDMAPEPAPRPVPPD